MTPAAMQPMTLQQRIESAMREAMLARDDAAHAARCGWRWRPPRTGSIELAAT